jgi:hypothetical protein
MVVVVVHDDGNAGMHFSFLLVSGDHEQKQILAHRHTSTSSTTSSPNKRIFHLHCHFSSPARTTTGDENWINQKSSSSNPS